MVLHKKLLLTLLATLSILWCQASDLTWKQAQQKKKGTIAIQYKVNAPFLLSTDGVLEGLEYEMMVGFQRYLSKQYGIEINYHWIEWSTLSEIFEQIQIEERAGDIGLDIISWTADREKNVKFSKPYFPDFQVLITHRSNPSILHENEFIVPYNDYTAISVLGTTYDQNLKKIRETGAHFNIRYIEQSTQVIDEIINSPKTFGYSDLTRYLLALNKDLPIKRLNAYAMKGHGLGVIFNKDSDWDIPFNEYLTSPDFERIKKGSVQRYFGSEFNEFIRNLSNHQDEEMVLLMQEKMFMDEEIEQSRAESERQEQIKNLLIIVVAFALLTAFFLFNRSKIKSNANKVLMAHKDTIEQKNELLSLRNKELTDINEEKNSYIHILSHDLRAPINNINSLSKLLQDAQLNPEESKLLNHITSESQRLSDMVTRILDIEKIESQRIDEYRPVDLTECLQKIVDNFQTTASDKHITIHSSLSPNTFLLGLDEFVYHVFENLLSNAIKFTPLHKNIYLTSEVQQNQLLIHLRDEGPGISEADQEKMFKKFQTLSAKATGGEKSNGIGLSIVHKYVSLLNGQLTYQSTLGEGTTFTVAFESVSPEGKNSVPKNK
ncbi:ATP-binding protein [Reichenbachiella carrageenanivorans]|uniref:histidine kinase n=1 Tax=Reichenbachiella carrageenanivorans TaxID=2979869 RepID=A0ABY6D078_9BACT|nr:ATP-binding protein [Reichenbachiella carrageenanivorans]UXX79542.1 ATP-binding protein [Reichenbachiella carrageenanivorans]